MTRLSRLIAPGQTIPSLVWANPSDSPRTNEALAAMGEWESLRDRPVRGFGDSFFYVFVGVGVVGLLLWFLLSSVF